MALTQTAAEVVNPLQVPEAEDEASQLLSRQQELARRQNKLDRLRGLDHTNFFYGSLRYLGDIGLSSHDGAIEWVARNGGMVTDTVYFEGLPALTDTDQVAVADPEARPDDFIIKGIGSMFVAATAFGEDDLADQNLGRFFDLNGGYTEETDKMLAGKLADAIAAEGDIQEAGRVVMERMTMRNEATGKRFESKKESVSWSGLRKERLYVALYSKLRGPLFSDETPDRKGNVFWRERTPLSPNERPDEEADRDSRHNI